MLLKNAMKKDMERAESKGRFLIDGFPRNKNNVDGWDNTVASEIDFKFVLFFECPEEECFRRCMDRGAHGSGRADDNEVSLRKRFATFQNDTWPIIQSYEKLSKVRQVDGQAQPDQVFEQVKSIFAEFN